MHTTDPNWIPGFISNRKMQHREVSIIGLSITLNVNKTETTNNVGSWFDNDMKGKHYRSKPSKTVINLKTNDMLKRSKTEPPMPSFRKAETNTQEVEFEYRKLRENDMYLLFPLDLTLRVKKHLDLSQDFDKEPKTLFWLEVKDAIIFMLNRDNMRFLTALNNHFKSMGIVHKNLHLRPTQPPKAQPKEWLIYAVRAVLEEKRRVSDFAKNPASLHKMKKYIDLYKRQQNIVIIGNESE